MGWLDVPDFNLDPPEYRCGACGKFLCSCPPCPECGEEGCEHQVEAAQAEAESMRDHYYDGLRKGE